jgi:Starch binding domain/IPT/TIG domain/Alpha amylase, C-terminal all-beta domain
MNSNVYIYERKLGSNVAVVAINRDASFSTAVSGLITSLPAGSYTDVLGGLLNGNNITVSAGGGVPMFTLAAGGVAVWQYSTAITTPTVAHVGPVLGKAGNTVTIDGRGFGTAKGTVFFGATPVTGASIASWEDTQIKAVVPSAMAGTYAVSVKNAASISSNAYNSFQLLTGPQVTVRFVVNNATTAPGESIYLTGDKFELMNWSATTPLGPMFNQVVYSYPSWYTDVSVPASSVINYKFIRKGATTTVWEGGSNHSFTAPATGTATVNVNWQN